ncbi:MAG: hypothetical protein E5W82_26195 [Mesorhizobium sp.]|uniref:hypothetical protein n=1 Tax=Mesorhizobium sp. TaxID=1871066 RepID=UPI0011F84650|nr:hypothetical protein [Mesorhizobium sp.]TIS54484.1 MAG: hypothetical protein E5W91_26755 [Mesorhizobium sp.]TJW06933.1 MAG: hypothetical protein E5W82_26195 [Mesorhizobium sp.]TJW32867.1 MAG: hypothetical protein E5W83_36245 [Mesorhizobium sp.]
MSAPLHMWTVYEGAKDVPTRYCARLWLVGSNGVASTDALIHTDAIEDLRDQFRAEGLAPLKRVAEDDPVIVEVWL